MALVSLGVADTLLRDGQMQRFDVDGKAILLTRIDGQYHAVRATCSHYGGPLDEGALSGTMVICPWHHACFDVRSGVRLEPPALNDIPRFAVTVERGAVMVETEPIAPAAIPGGGADTRAFVIIGGGAAGNAAAEELRRQGFGGRIVILSASAQVPIDRPNVSKDYLDGHAKAEWMPLRGASWYAERGIEMRLNMLVNGVDTARKTVSLAHGERIQYDKLLIATGGIARTLRIPGASLKNIFTLRDQADADEIIAAKGESGAKAVVIGSSFIGMEAATALASTGVSVTVVGLEAVPFENVLGARIGTLFQKLHEQNGVTFRLNSGVEKYVGPEGGAVTGVQIRGGEVLPCDFVVVGVGVAPATGFLNESGLKLNERDRAVLVDETLQAAPDVWAAGDIARYAADGATERIEHWRVAQQHGILAARAMLGKPEPVTSRVPFFWTKQWGVSLRYVGHADKWDEIITHGTVAPDGKFIAYYIADGQVKAAAGVGHDREIAALNLLMRDGRAPSAEQLRDPEFDFAGS